MGDTMNISRWKSSLVMKVTVFVALVYFLFMIRQLISMPSPARNEEGKRDPFMVTDTVKSGINDNHDNSNNIAINDNSNDRKFEAKDGHFYVNGEKIKIFSGALHYFRVVPEYWKDRLKRLKAAGLNTVETYVPWNLHEEIKGRFTFTGRLDIKKFIKLAHELGLYVILRPGPYICSEWDFGGLPSWLLAFNGIKLRTNHPTYMQAVDEYFTVLFKQVVSLQFHQGGPIIMVQIENEYGSFGDDVNHIIALKQIMEKNGISELFFLSENQGGLQRFNISGVMLTGNFKKVDAASKTFNYLKKVQPEYPLMAMEFWSGWFDQWGKAHTTFSNAEFKNTLTFMLNLDASFNLYMFHGGTNFGFMNGALHDEPDVTSYDYDAPLSESGGQGAKYDLLRQILPKYTTPAMSQTGISKLNERPTVSYSNIDMKQTMSWEKILAVFQQHMEPLRVKQPVFMEKLDYQNSGGQGYGFTLYRHLIPINKRKLKLHGTLNGRALVLLNGQQLTLLGVAKSKTKEIDLQSIKAPFKNAQHVLVLDILVENLGRNNYAPFKSDVFDNQHRGLDGKVTLDNKELNDWSIYPLDFKTEFVNKLSQSSSWKSSCDTTSAAPSLHQGILTIKEKPEDTFLHMIGWEKGVVFINGFNLGRYWNTGPTRTLYLPAPLLKVGNNELMVFELHSASCQVASINHAILM